MVSSRRSRGLFGPILFAAALIMASCGDDQTAVPAPAAERSLFGTAWWISSATRDGASVVIDGQRAARVRWEFIENGGCDGLPDCPDGPKLIGNDGCNDFTRSVTVDGTTIHPGGWGMSTAAYCGDPVVTAVSDVMRGEAFVFSIDGDVLRVSSVPAGVDLTFETSDAPFGPAPGQVLDEGTAGDVEYRLVWNGGLTLEYLDPAGGPRPSTMGVGPDPGRINALRGDLGGRAYLLGIVPAGAVRAVYEPGGSPAVELALVRTTEPDGLVIGELVDATPDEWSVVAYDSAGAELHRLSWLSPTATTVSAAAEQPPSPPAVSSSTPACVEVPIGVPTQCPIGTHCGITMFSSKVNGQWWKSDEGAGQLDYIPIAWGTYTDPPIEVTVVVTDDPEPTLTASLNDHAVTYHPVAESEVDWCA